MKADLKSNMPSISRLTELQQLIADFSEVKRFVPIANKGRLENDVEHSYGLAITSWYLATKLAPHLDIGKVLQYALAHDLVEIHSGDTFAFDPTNVATKSDREDAALKQLTKDLPDFLELVQSAKNYKDKADAEARFVYVVDKILPPLMVVLSADKDFWKRHKITQQMHANEKLQKMKFSPELKGYAVMLNVWLNNQEYFYEG